MTTATLTDVSDAPADAPADHRGSWIPTPGMIATRILELRKRRGLMIAIAVVTIGIPVVFLVIRLLLHAFDPKTYGPAGGYDLYTSMVSLVLYVFGFIVAATLGATAGSSDLTDGMFRHLVVTGRSRLALYLARIPAGLAIIVPLVAAGFTLVCLVCVFAAPTQLQFNGVNMPANLSRPALESWAGAGHQTEVICNFGVRISPSTPDGPLINNVEQSVACGNGPPPGSSASQPPTQAQITEVARQVAGMNYSDYSKRFLVPSNSLMIRSGLWLELEAAIGFIVGLGLGSLIGQRTVAVVLMIVLEVILTPGFARAHIPHLLNLQRGVVGVAMAHLTPGGLPVIGGGGGGPGGGGPGGNPALIPETITVSVCVIVAWLVVWSALGAWRMVTRDA
jgi:hypothetical protein